MAKIKRTKTRAEGGITPQEKAEMKTISEKWTAIAFRTEPIDKDQITRSIEKLYQVSGLKKPRVVVVPSPKVMAFAYGASAAIWHVRKSRAATDAATDDATAAATDDATDAATDAATYAATDAATYAATDAATRAATYDATTACFLLAGEFGLRCATMWNRAYQGGNMWAFKGAFFDAVQNVLKLELPEFEKYAAWDDCIKHGGFRVMHEEFCIVSDFPETLKIDDQNRPHCEDGPSHLWRDGWALYHWHGTKIPDEWIENPETLTAKTVLTMSNIEVRAAGMDMLGWANMLDDLGAVLVDSDPDPLIGELYSVVLPDLDGRHLIVRYTCPRNGVMGQPVPPRNHIDNEEITTVMAAKAFLADTTLADYLPPEIRT